MQENPDQVHRSLLVNDAAVEEGVSAGWLTVDTRLRDRLRGDTMPTPSLGDDVAFAQEIDAMLTLDWSAASWGAWTRSSGASQPSRRNGAGSIDPVTRPSDSAVVEPKPARSVGRRAVDRVGDALAFRPDRVTVIRPAARWPRLDLRELWHYRELLGRFVWRDVKVRYKQTFDRRRLGDPAAVPDDGRLHARLREVREVPDRESCRIRSSCSRRCCRGTYFSSALGGLEHEPRRRTSPLVTKVYFPRVLLPLAAVARADRRLPHRRSSCSSG